MMPSYHEICFIWFGGAVPQGPINHINAWISFKDELNRIDPQHQFYITIMLDKQGSSESSISKTQNSFQSGDVTFKDISEEKVANEYIRYEINRMRPNFGSASDMSRYEKLIKSRSCIYYDTDVLPPTSAENYVKLWLEPDNRLYCASLPGSTTTNDVLMVKQEHNRILMELCDYYKKSYQIEYSPSPEDNYSFYLFSANEAAKVWQRCYMSDTAEHIRARTILLTGPDPLRYIYYSYLGVDLKDSQELLEKSQQRMAIIAAEQIRVPLEVTNSAGS